MGRRLFRLPHHHPLREVVAIIDRTDRRTLSQLLKNDCSRVFSIR
nr:hypothetical protein [Aestuariivivens sediminicola]